MFALSKPFEQINDWQKETAGRVNRHSVQINYEGWRWVTGNSSTQQEQHAQLSYRPNIVYKIKTHVCTCWHLCLHNFDSLCTTARHPTSLHQIGQDIEFAVLQLRTTHDQSVHQKLATAPSCCRPWRGWLCAVAKRPWVLRGWPHDVIHLATEPAKAALA